MKKPFHLFLDDIRELSNPKFDFSWYKDKDWTICKNSQEAKDLIIKKGLPQTISFDHDLGEDKNGNVLESGYEFCQWICNFIMDNNLNLPLSFEFKVHSDNPVGKVNIESYLNNFINHYSSQK